MKFLNGLEDLDLREWKQALVILITFVLKSLL